MAILRPFENAQPMVLGGFQPANTAHLQWFRDLRTRVNGVVPQGFVSVVDFGADVTGVNDSLLAFQNAAAELSPLGGTIIVPPGVFRLSATFDMATLGYPITLQGAGYFVTRIVSDTLTTEAILVSDYPSNNTRVNDLELIQALLTPTPVFRAGNYGLALRGAQFSSFVSRCVIRGFGDDGIYLHGQNGPIVLEDCIVIENAGWGINVDDPGGVLESCQDVTIQRGAVQGNYGGIRVETCPSFSCYDCDIEQVNDDRPAVYVTGNTFGPTFVGVTASINGNTGMPAVVHFDQNVVGAQWIGGIIAADGIPDVPLVLLDGAGVYKNVFIGGSWIGGGSGTLGYAAVVSGGSIQNYFLNPFLAGFHGGLETVNSVGGVASKTTAIGIGMNNATAATATGGAGSLPANPVAFIVQLLPDGTSVRVPYYSA